VGTPVSVVVIESMTVGMERHDIIRTIEVARRVRTVETMWRGGLVMTSIWRITIHRRSMDRYRSRNWSIGVHAGDMVRDRAEGRDGRSKVGAIAVRVPMMSSPTICRGHLGMITIIAVH
jgi:hypothetical protein